MMRALSSAGVSFDVKARSVVLEALCRQHDLTWDSRDVTRDETRDDDVTTRGNHIPVPTTQEDASASSSVTASPSRAGSACRAMRIAGLADVNPSHPMLLRLLDAGVTDDELRLAAAEASAKHKPFTYALATVEGRRKDAARAGAVPAAASPALTLTQQLAPMIARG